MQYAKRQTRSSPRPNLKWILIGPLVALVITIITYALTFKDNPIGGPGDWEQFASFISGILTPLVALCSVFLFYYSIEIQVRELEQTRDEMRAATNLQASAEQARENLNRQHQLEQTIPRVRQIQKDLFERIGQIPDRISDSIRPFEDTGYRTQRSKLFEVAKRQDLMDSFGSLLTLYTRKGEHAIKMLKEYLDVGGDIYVHLDIIDEIESENDELFQFIRIFGFKDDIHYQRYIGFLEKLYSTRDKSMERY